MWCRAIGFGRAAAGAFLLAACLLAAPARAADQPMVAPPRSVTDITAILDQQKPDPARIQRARAAADAQPPADLKGAALAQFWFDRAVAADTLGRVRQRLDDLRKAVAVGEKDDGDAFDLFRAIVHLAVAEQRVGNYRTVAALRERAIGLAGKMKGRVVTVGADLAIGAARMGDFAGAKRWLAEAESALDKIPQARKSPAQVDTWKSNLLRARGEVAEHQGRVEEAEKLYRESLAASDRALASGVDDKDTVTTRRDFVREGLARTLAAAGRPLEAELELRQALLSQLQMRGRFSPEVATILTALADVLREQGRGADAGRLGQAALEILEGIGVERDAPPLLTARVRIAQAEIAQRRWAEALALFEEARRDASAEAREKGVETNFGYLMALVRTGHAGDAVGIAERIVKRRRGFYGDEHYLTAEGRGGLAAALAAAGQRDRAMAEFRAALPVLLAPTAGQSFGREGRLRFILEAYLGLLATPNMKAADGSDAATTAFRIAEQLRQGSVQEAIAAAAARSAARDPALADLVRREQDAKAQRAALYDILNDLLASPPEERDDATVRELQTAVKRLADERTALRAELGKRFPDYAALVDPAPATVETARKALRPGEALIATFAAADALYTWAVPREGAVAFASAPLPWGRVAGMVQQLRKALDPAAANLADIPPFDVGTAQKLFAATLGAVEPGWRGAASLVVVAHGPLGALPFALLVTKPSAQPADAAGTPRFSGYRGVPFLARETAVAQLPSTAALAALRALPPGSPARRNFLGFGDPLFTPEQAKEATRQVAEVPATRGITLRALPSAAALRQATRGLAALPRLPDTALELRAVAEALGADAKSDVVLGAAASEARVRAMKLDDRKVVMFATHGLVPGDLDGLTQPALALTSPSVAVDGGDGLLTMEKILALKLDADWVVLSACNTAAGEGAGAEAVSGLGRAFFYAGARALLVTNWPVETHAARSLTTDMFRRVAASPGTSRAEALRAAELALIDGPGATDAAGKTVFAWAHPIFWAPFSLIGDGG